jgi:organic radical activating enzyme
MGTADPAVRIQAPVLEVFASIQGEGLYVGEPQVFVRLRGCPLRCRWCDTKSSWTLAADDRARIAVAEGPARREPSFATPFQVACWIAEVEPGTPRAVSLTGGEPLVWPEFVLGLRAMIGSRRLHLETAGAHPETLARVIDRVDHVSLDLKPELDLDAPVEIDAPAAAIERSPTTRAEWARARQHCLLLVAGRDACGKIVVSGERTLDELVPLFDEIESCAPGLRVYLQPATPMNGVRAPATELLENACELARDRDIDVRVVPQIHRVLKMP